MAPPNKDKQPPVTCAVPAVGDWAIDDKTALLFSSEAPREQKKGPRDDASAIWAFVPDAFDYAKPEVLFYFHGHNNYVKVGYCDHKEGMIPDWVMPIRRGDTASKASGPKYGLNKLPATPHAPLVLVPEVGRDDPGNHGPEVDKVLDTAEHYKDWKAQKKAWDDAKAAFDQAVQHKVTPLPAKPPPPPEPVPAKIPPAITEMAGRMSDPGQVKKMIDDCCNRLRLLPKRDTAANTYLDKTPAKFVDSSKLKRLYLTGHSGGGVPLSAACKSTIARLTGKDDMPTDLWVLDGTYGGGLSEYSTFCKELADQNKLGNGPALSRFVGVVIRNSGTDVSSKRDPPPRMTEIVKEMKALGLDKFIKEIEFKSDKDLPALEKALLCNPIVIVRQNAVEHDEIPGKFIPILLKTAGQLGTDCGGPATTGFLLKVIDTNDQPLAGAKVTVSQQGNAVLASKLDGGGTVFVQGHEIGQPCDVAVEGFGGLGREGQVDPDEPDDGTLPEYDAGSAPDGDGSCGGDYTPPVILA